jgi:N-acylglucosamine 2-epimerase
MIFSLVFDELGRVSGREDVQNAALDHARQVMTCFRRGHGLVLEYVQLDGSALPGGQGRVVVPGHAIECMWFMVHILGPRRDRLAVDAALECIRRHLEFGWDVEFGGIFLGGDAEGRDPVWPHWDKKIWWPHTEALYALLLAYEVSREDWCLDWYWRVHAWSFAHFPDPVHGEWRQRLDRQGRVLDRFIALPVKDPFHLPRAVIYILDVLDRLV